MKGSTVRIVAVFGVLLLGMLWLASPAAACPTCKLGLGGHDNAEGVIAGYFWSILFMMSMPFLTFGGIGGYFVYLARKGRSTAAGTSGNVAGHAERNTAADEQVEA